MPLKEEPSELKQEVYEENAELELSVKEIQNRSYRLTQTNTRREVFEQLEYPLPED